LQVFLLFLLHIEYFYQLAMLFCPKQPHQREQQHYLMFKLFTMLCINWKRWIVLILLFDFSATLSKVTDSLALSAFCNLSPGRSLKDVKTLTASFISVSACCIVIERFCNCSDSVDSSCRALYIKAISHKNSELHRRWKSPLYFLSSLAISKCLQRAWNEFHIALSVLKVLEPDIENSANMKKTCA